MRFLRFMSTPTGRAIRVAMGLGIVALGLVAGGPAGWVIAAFGLLPLATGAAGVCPISPLVGQPFRAARCGRKPSHV